MECNFPPPPCNNNTITSSSSKTRRNEKKGVKKSKGSSSVKLSTDPQSVAARERRHRISDRFKILQSMVPGGSKMDTVSMLEEAIHYVKFLKTQIWLHQTMINFVDDDHMFIPQEHNNFHSLDQHINPNSGSIEPLDTLPQLPLEQFCFQGEEENKFIFNMPL